MFGEGDVKVDGWEGGHHHHVTTLTVVRRPRQMIIMKKLKLKLGLPNQMKQKTGIMGTDANTGLIVRGSH